MASFEQIKRTVEELSGFYQAHRDGNDLIVSNAGAWEFDEIEEVSEALGTKAIDDEDGCGSCGFGATIRVKGILDNG
jgi:hypothetical protein